MRHRHFAPDRAVRRDSRARALLFAAACAATSAGCGTGTIPTAASTSPAPAAGAAGPESCRLDGGGLYVLPDATCTPGVTNPSVTEADIYSTICKAGWSSGVRPPESYTEPLKKSGLAAYGEPGSLSGYEEDHLIPLELGGSPTSQRNLWPEPGASPNPKDAVEDAANRAVCDGRLNLAAAQDAIATDWIAFGEILGVTPPGRDPSGRAAAGS